MVKEVQFKAKKTMRQNKTANEVAQRFGLEYCPKKVSFKEKRNLRDLTPQDDTIKLSIIICMALGFWGASCIVVLCLWGIYTLLGLI